MEKTNPVFKAFGIAKPEPPPRRIKANPEPPPRRKKANPEPPPRGITTGYLEVSDAELVSSGRRHTQRLDMATKSREQAYAVYEADEQLSDEIRNHIISNLEYLTKNLDTEQILQPLTQLGVLSLEKKDEVKAESTPARQAEVLLNIIMRGSGAQYAGLLHSLKESNQDEVLGIINNREPKSRGTIEKVRPKLLVKLKCHEDTLIRNLRFEGSLLVQLCSAEVITETQMYDLKALDNRLKRSEALLAYIRRGANDERIGKFAIVLAQTGQAHLSALLLGEGTPDLLTRDDRRALRPNMAKYVEGLKETGALNNLRELAETGVVTEAQREEIEHKSTPRQRAELLLEMLMCRPLTALQKLPKCIGAGVYEGLTGTSGQSGPILLPLPGPTGLDEIAEHESSDETKVKQLEEPGETEDREDPQGETLVKSSEKDRKEKPEESKYKDKLKEFQKKESRSSNRQIQKEFGLDVGKAVFFITLLIVPRSVLVHGEEELKQGFEQQHTMYVDMPSIFDPDLRGYHPHRVLVLGAAGAGKSTLLQHACEQWGLGAVWKHVKYIFNLTCRRLNQMVENKTNINILDLLLKHGPIIAKEEEELVRREILSNLENVLIVVDGADELSGWIEFSPENVLPIRDIQESAGILELINSLMVGDLMGESCVLFTSRPIDRINADLFDKTVKIFGFGRTSIESCLLALANGDVNEQKAALQYLDHRPQLYLFCTLPLGCIMTGRVVLDELSPGSKDKAQHESINCATVLYIFVLLVFLNRRGQHTKKIKDRFEGVYVWCKTLFKMMKLAAWGMLRKSPRIIFSSQDTRVHSIDEDDLPCGLLDITTDEKDATANTEYTSAAFLHYTIQEFLTALHIAITWTFADIKLITERKSAHQFNMVLLYLSGLLGNPLGKKLIQILDEQITEKILEKRLTKLFDTLDVEYGGRLQFLPTLTKRGKDNSKLMKLQLIRCISESNHRDMVRKIDSLVLKAGVLDLTNMPGGLLPEHMPAVAFYLTWSEKVSCLRLEPGYCSSLLKMKTPESERRLVGMIDTALLQSGRLYLHGLQLPEEEAVGLSTYVLSTKSLNAVGKFSAVQLMKGITAENQGRLIPLLDRAALQSGVLNLEGPKLSKPDIAGIVTYVLRTKSLRRVERDTAVQLMRGITAENQAQLVPLLDTGALLSGVLNLEGTKLSDIDIAAIVTYVLSTRSLRTVERDTAVQLMRGITAENQARLVPVIDRSASESGELDLSGRSLAEGDVSVLAHYVGLSLRITYLSLRGNRIKEGVKSIAAALHVNRTLTNLGLGGNQITAQGGEFIAAALHVNRTLTHLYLHSNDISDVGAESLATALRNNATLKYLDIGKNEITDVGADQLASALRENRSLTKLRLVDNKLSNDKERQMMGEFGGRVDLYRIKKEPAVE